jgi:hypothetical protein
VKQPAVRTRWWDTASLNWSLVFASLFLASGCGSGTWAHGVAEELKTVSSWAATSHMVGDAWMAGSVPTSYAAQTLFGVQQQLQEERRRILSRSIPAETRGAVLRQLDSLEATINQMLTVVRRGDRRALAQPIGQLSAAEEALVSLAKGS